jgi:hypothetical protein
MKARTQTLPASRWPWLDRVSAAWVAVMVALLLGILTFAAVREISIECKREPDYILTTENGDRLMLEDGSGFLVSEEKRLHCRFGLGDRFATFP